MVTFFSSRGHDSPFLVKQKTEYSRNRLVVSFTICLEMIYKCISPPATYQSVKRELKESFLIASYHTKDAIFYFSRANMWKISKLNVITKKKTRSSNEILAKGALNENNIYIYIFKESKNKQQQQKRLL